MVIMLLTSLKPLYANGLLPKEHPPTSLPSTMPPEIFGKLNWDERKEKYIVLEYLLNILGSKFVYSMQGINLLLT